MTIAATTNKAYRRSERDRAGRERMVRFLDEDRGSRRSLLQQLDPDVLVIHCATRIVSLQCNGARANTPAGEVLGP
jgi:hypothetical protein